MTRRRDWQRFAREMQRGFGEQPQLWNFFIFGAEQVAEIYFASWAGDEEAAAFLKAVRALLSNLQRGAARRDPTLCVLCDHAFSRGRLPAALIIVTADVPPQGRALGNVLCEACYSEGRDIEELHARIVSFYTRTLMPDARLVAQPGHA